MSDTRPPEALTPESVASTAARSRLGNESDASSTRWAARAAARSMTSSRSRIMDSTSSSASRSPLSGTGFLLEHRRYPGCTMASLTKRIVRAALATPDSNA